jgi:two-component system sensor histidine kinase YesM
MFKRLYHLSFATRIWLSFVLLITVSILATGWASFHIASNTLQRNAMAMSQDTVNKAGQVFDEKLQKIVVSMMSLMMSDSFYKVTGDSASGNASRYFTHLSAMQPVFSQLLFNEPILQSVLLVTPIGDFYPTNINRNPNYSFYDTRMYEEIKKNRKAFWIEGHEDQFFSGKDRVVSLVIEGVGKADRPIQNIYVMVNIKEKDLLGLLKQNLSSSSSGIFVLNGSGEAVMKPSLPSELASDLNLSDLQKARLNADQGNKETSGSFAYHAGKEDYLVNYHRSDLVPDWIVYRMQSKSELLSQADAIKWAAVAIMSACVVAALVLSNLMSRFLTRPITKLVKVMLRVETKEDLGTRYRSPYRDEVSRAGEAFNTMLHRVEHLVQDIHETEQSKRRAEMKALTAQIDPHFFYNALHTVYCKSVLGQNEHVNEMIIALSDMFRLGLNNGEDVTTLQAELDHVRQYLIIQQNCYEELFDYGIEQDEDVPSNLAVLKLILQPLVENSILHGFRERGEGGIIQIRARRKDGMLELSVADNGDGFEMREPEDIVPESGPASAEVSTGPARSEPGASAADIEQQETEAASARKHGYALRNIRDRLALYYEHEAGLYIESEPGVGTKVTITIPMERAGGNDGNDGSEAGGH